MRALVRVGDIQLGKAPHCRSIMWVNGSTYNIFIVGIYFCKQETDPAAPEAAAEADKPAYY